MLPVVPRLASHTNSDSHLEPQTTSAYWVETEKELCADTQQPTSHRPASFITINFSVARCFGRLLERLQIPHFVHYAIMTKIRTLERLLQRLHSLISSACCTQNLRSLILG
ncbi:hypothetical protein KCU87_g540, partial [Aureobasidium melanogenum]